MLSVKEVKKHFASKTGVLKAVDGVSFDVPARRIVGLIGESGSGKSTLGKLIVGLHEKSGGEVFWQGEPMPARFSHRDFSRFSRDIQMIFQDPYSALNPRMQVWQILEEPCLLSGNRAYLKLSSRERLRFIQAYLERVGLRPEFYSRFPHEFSGGQQQRIGIARALIQEPKLLICDEPVSALDVSVQAQIVNLLKALHQETGMAMLFIAHDLAMVNYLCDEVAVMYLGRIVEKGNRDEIFFNPAHPYTKLLLASNPSLASDENKLTQVPLIEGEIPSPVNLPTGCAFAARCWKKTDRCMTEPPGLVTQSVAGESERLVACFNPEA